MDFIFFKSSWIPASAGMTTKNHAFLMFVSPAKAGVQFEAFKRKGFPTNDVWTIMDSFSMDKKTFFNQMAATWDQHFYTPGLKQHLEALVPLFHLRPGSKVLDVGAGTGGIIPYLLRAIGSEGSIWSVDFAAKMVEIGREKYKDEPRVRHYLSAVEALPFADEFFHHIVCFGAFPHFADKPLALEEMHRVLKRDGTLIIAHALSSQEIKQHHMGAAPVSQDFLPEETEMRSLLESTGFHVLQLIDRPKCYLCEAQKKS